jgi:hypothetical protein
MMAKRNNSDPDAVIDNSYLLKNSGQQAGARFDALAAMFDSSTIRHIKARGIR